MSQFRGILILWFGVGLLYSRSVVGTVRTNKQFSGFFGCNFSDVCKESEVCIDDDLFGNCQDKYREKDYFAYSLKLETLQLLETDLQRLIDAGYDWTNLYTQCVVSNILLSSRLAHEPDRRFCDSRAPVPDWMRRLQRENEAEEKLQKEVEDEEDDDDDDDDDDDEKDVAGAGGEDAMTALQKFIADYESDFKDVGDSNADKRLSDGKFVDVHKYVKATRKKSSSGSSDWVYPRPPPSRRAYESKSRRVFNDDLDDDVEQTRPTESDYEWLTSRYDLRKYLKQLDLKELEVLHKYLTAMKGVLISPSKGLFESAATTSSNNNNNDDGDYYNATPDDYFESGIPTSSAAEKLPFINEVMPDSESAPRPSWQPEYDLPPTARIVPTEFDEDFDSDYDLSKSDVLPIDQIYDEEKFGNDADGEEEETMAELRKTMTPEDAKLLSDLLNGKVKLNELSDDNIEKMTQYVMTLLDDSETPAFGEKEGGKIAAKDETNDDDDDENVDESAMVDNGDRLKDSDVNDNREMLNAQALNRPNNEQSIFSVEVKKAAPGVVAQPRHDDIVAPLPAALSEDDNEQKSGHYDLVLTDRAYIKVDKPFKDTQDAEELLAIVESKLGLKPGSFSNVQWKKDMISFRVNSDVAGANADAISKQIMEIVPAVKAVTGVQIIKSGVGDKLIFVFVFVVVVAGCEGNFDAS
ncbi:uncharacterized protein LOC141912222 [Tubulanus polymorphus]|uniref:uncharacterized protein LOC141912222 n=1 Tax=Tubulanus polymorphus TaxID=672921 RepID=UPI003DA2E818